GLHVIGIEPNADMRRTAESARTAQNAGPAEYRDGRAESTGLPDRSADAVLSAQAFHWFATDAALHALYRIVKPSGWLALMWNEQDRTDQLTADYMRSLIRNSPAPGIAADVHFRHGEILFSSPLFREAQRTEFPHVQDLSCDELLGRAFSASYAP